MNRSKIEWCNMTWNPVTGCLHGCPYCYARKITHRFAFRFDGYGQDTQRIGKDCENNELHELTENQGSPYPYGFDPTFHRYRLDEPQRIKKPQNIFVCSMADLFGDFIPDSWIQQVFAVCEKAPQHRYLFLTKNPERYIKLNAKEILPDKVNYWFGTTATTEESVFWYSLDHNYFISIEPIMGKFSKIDIEAKRIAGARSYPNWVIIGAETGNRKGKVIPKREWIENIVKRCRKNNVPVFMKNSLAEIWAEPLIQEYPWKELV